MINKCQRCHVENEDLRTLWSSCFYEMNEMGLPFKQVILKDLDLQGLLFYTLEVCKTCRGEWMESIKDWFERSKDPFGPGHGSGIWIRRHGRLLEISEEEWAKLNPERAPVKIKGKINEQQ